MSGIVGIFEPGGAPARSGHTERMLRTLSHRGPDGTVVWTSGAVGLGHAAHCTTPEAEAETWPHVSETTGTVLVADARIDNRADLLRALDPAPNEDGVVTDADLISAAYDRWGQDCPEHLIGDFAFALWDERGRRLFCARDAVGTRPFFYAPRAGNRFVFGSEIKALFAHPSVRRAVREESIAEYLAGIVSDDEATFYQDVHRLPPGHALAATPDGLRTWPYWLWDPEREIDLPSDEAYAEAFRAHFDEAVRCRLRSNQRVGSYLSGGLDSSSIAVTAQALLQPNGRGAFPTFSTVYDRFPACDERTYMQAVVDRSGVEPHFFRGDDVNGLRNLEDLLAIHDEPFFAPNLATRWTTLPQIRETGTSVVLDGHGGDEVVSRGQGRLHDLARSGHWATVGREVWQGSMLMGGDLPLSLWGRLLEHYGLQSWVEDRPWAQRLYGWMCRLRASLPDGASSSPSPSRASVRLLDPEIRARFGMKERRRRLQRKQAPYAHSARGEHYLDLASPMQGRGLEILNRTAAHRGMELRFPFLDRRLMAFCLALPADQKRRYGWGRYVLRTAVRHRLPAMVRRRRSKVDFTTHVASGLMSERMMLDALLLDRTKPVRDYLYGAEVDDLVFALEAHGESTSGQVLFGLWRALVLSQWMQRGTPADHPPLPLNPQTNLASSPL